MSSDTQHLIEQALWLHGDDTTKVAYRVLGRGPALLLIHGFPLHGLTFRHLVPALSRTHTCVLVDLPGAGESVWTDTTDFSFSAHARRLKRLMYDLGFSQYAVLGQDSGGLIARHLALAAPREVQKLVLINTEIPHHRPPWIPFYQKVLRVPASTYALQSLLRSRAFRKSSAGFGGCFCNKDLIDGEFCELFVAPLIRENRRAQGYARYLLGFDWRASDMFTVRHRDIACPVYFIWGREDPTFPCEHGRAMAEQFSQVAAFEVIDDAKLLPHEEHADAVSRLLCGFLKKEESKELAHVG